MFSKGIYRLIGIALASICALVACGGGGGGSVGPVSPPPPTSFGTLAINQNNAEAIAFGLSMSEGALAVAQAAINATIIFGSDAGVPTRNCGNTGTLAVTHQDNDTSFDITPGDLISITFTDCFDRILDANVNGTIAIAVATFALDNASANLAGELNTQDVLTLTDRFDPTNTTNVMASIGFDFSLQNPEVLRVSASALQRLTIEIGGTAESISDFEITKTATRLAPGSAAQNVDTEVSIDLFYESQLLGGTFSCQSTDLRFDGNITGSSLAAEVLCRGLNNSGVRITNSRDVQIDAEGDGTFALIGILEWDQVIDGFLETDSGLVLGDLLGDINMRRTTMHTNDVTYDALRDRMLIATSASDPVFPNAIVEMSLNGNTVDSLFSFAFEPNRVRLAEDGSVFYVSFTGMPEVRPYDADTLQELPTIMITSDQPFSPDFAVLDMDVSPTDPNVIAVAFQFVGTASTDVALFNGNAQLLNTYRDVTSFPFRQFDGLDFSSDGSRLFAADVGISGGSILALDADGVSGSSVVSNGFASRLSRVGNRLYSGALAFDEDTMVRLGTYASSPRATGIDMVNNMVYIVEDDKLTAFRRDSFVPLAVYNLGIDQASEIRAIVPAGDSFVMVDDDTLHIINVADVETLNSDQCDVASLMTNENEAYTNYICPVVDAVYDSSRNRIYAAVNSELGVNGNSIAVIDNATGLVDSYIYIGSEPRQIELSADGNQLYAIFDGANVIATVDLNSLSLSREQQIDVFVTPGAVPTIRPRHAIRVRASTIENDTIVVSIGEPTSSPFERLTAIRDGVRLADDVMKNDLESSPSNAGPHIIFDDAGQIYSLTGSGQGALVQSVLLGPTGLTAGPFFEVAGTSVGTGQVDIMQNEVFTALGTVINLTNQTGEARYDTRAPSFDDNRGGLAVNANVPSGDVYIYVKGDNPGSGLGRYDYSSGVLAAEQAIDSFPSSPHEISLFDIGTTHLGIAPGRSAGLVVIDKDHVQ